MASQLLESNYTHRLTLFQVLTKVSPQIEPLIDEPFGHYLRSNVLVTNGNLQNQFDQLLAVPNLEAQKQFIRKFRKHSNTCSQGSIYYLPLFNNLVGVSFKGFIDKCCSIFREDPSGSLFHIAGAQFHYRLTDDQSSIERLYSSTENVDPSFRAIIHAVKNNPTVNCSDADRMVLDEWKLDKKNRNKYANDPLSVIHRHDLLYSRMSFGIITFPWCLQDSDSSSAFKKVLKQFFTIDCTKINIPHQLKLEKYFRKIQSNYRKCRLDNLLRKHCPLPRIKSPGRLKLADALVLNTSHKSIFKFIYAVYYAIFPVQVFGSRRNQRKFYQNLKQLFTASLVTKFRVFDIASGIVVEEMRPLFADFPYYVSNGTVETHFLCWVFECMKCLVKSKFYITEGANHKYSPLFYRYDLWAHIRHHAMAQLAQKGKWQQLKPATYTRCQQMAEYIKHSVLRLIPKKNSLRPITSLKFYHKAIEYKRMLRVCLLLLKKVGRLAAFDSQTGSAHKIHERIAKLKGGAQSSGPFYVVRGDFEDCYQSIDLVKLLGLVKQSLSLLAGQANDDKLLIEHINVLRKRGHFYAKRSDFLVKPTDCKRESLFHGNDLARLATIAAEQLTTQSLQNCILSSGGSECIKLSVALEIVMVYLGQSHIRLGKKTSYRMMKGIRQGGPLSGELCELYLSCLWRQVFSESLHIDAAADLSQFFLSVVDDFLFVTTDLQKAQSFAAAVRDGFPDWGLKMNPNKFITNFDIDTGKVDNTVEITFFGRKIYSKDLSIGLDLRSFTSQRIADTFSCNPFLPVIQIMKMCSSTLHFNCWPEMVDLNIMPVDQVVTNLFERILLQAFRFASFLCSSPAWRKCGDKLGGHICLLIYRMADRLSKMINKWKRRLSSLQFPLSRLQLQYIAASAFCLLWKIGPHKIRCRVGEKKAICIYRKQLCQRGAHLLDNGERICVPEGEMKEPFNSLKI